MSDSVFIQPSYERQQEQHSESRTQAPRNVGRTASSIEQKVQSLIVEQLGVDAGQVDNNASFVDGLGADSLDLVELVMAFEEAFDLEIPDEDAEKITTVGDAIEYVKSKTRFAASSPMTKSTPCIRVRANTKARGPARADRSLTESRTAALAIATNAGRALRTQPAFCRLPARESG